MTDRRVTGVIFAFAVLLVAAMLWDAVRGDDRPVPPAAPDTALVVPPRPPDSATGSRGMTPPPPPQDRYIEQLARAETRRQLRAAARLTYLNEIVAASNDSMLHRWDNRINDPVRVFLGPGTAANYQPAFLDAIRTAFARWQNAGVPVRFELSGDTAGAEVVFKWRAQFDIDRTGQTDLTWNQDGHIESATVTLATFNQLGQAMGPDEIRVVALHEIGHLIGLDHSPDSTDLMFPVAKVRELTDRDIETALLLYRLTPGSLR
jgi:matrixin